MTHSRILSITISVLILLFTGTSLANQRSEKIALAEALEWLAMVDNGDYGDTWDNAASLFKNALQRSQWIQSMNAVRTPLGGVLKRVVKSVHYATGLPGAPDGEYVVIQFETSFEHKRQSTESVTPMLDKDGTWRVSGYYIK